MLTAKNAALQPFVNALVEVSDQEGYSISPRYSGRGMMGETCLGLTHGRSSEFDIAMEIVLHMSGELAGDQLNDALEAMGDLRTKVDSMGRSTIIYWEGLQVDGHVDGADDEEGEDDS